MPRMARVVIPGIPHHITQRGNRREQVFFTDAHYQRYLALLCDYAERHGLSIQSYCLMSNHVHLIAVPRRQSSLSRTLKPVHLRYAQEANAYLGQSGYLWQGRFFSCPLDERHFWSAVRYVERNPVCAGLVKRAEDYPFSSAAGHCGLREDPLLSDNLEQSDHVGDWQAWLRDEDAPQTIEYLRQATRTGRPAGNEAFIKKLERTLGRRLRALPIGRPKKNKTKRKRRK